MLKFRCNVFWVFFLVSRISPGDDGIVYSSGFSGGRETEAACSGKFLQEMLKK